MNTAPQIWGLWDCEELLSVHLNHDDVLDARDEHLERCRCFADDQDSISAAVEIRSIRLPTEIVRAENPDQGTGAGHHEQTAISPGTAQPRHQRGGGRYASR